MRSRAIAWGPAAIAVSACTAALVLRPPDAHGQVDVRVRAATRIELEAAGAERGVAGRLVDDQGQPLAGRRVTVVVRTAGRAETRATETDAAGRFGGGPVGVAGSGEITASFGGDDLHEGSRGSRSLPAAHGAGQPPAEQAAPAARPSSAWLLVPIGICLLVMLGARGIGGRRGPGGAGATRAGRRGARAAGSQASPAAAPSLRSRAAAAFRPAALAVLPSQALWRFATPRETLEHARARPGGAPASLLSFAGRVEQTCYGRDAPTLEEVETLERQGEHVAEALRGPRD